MAGLKKERMDFMDGWITKEKYMDSEEDAKPDVLGLLFGDDQGEVFDRLMASLAEGEDGDVLGL
jgi:hypothetical protein